MELDWQIPCSLTSITALLQAYSSSISVPQTHIHHISLHYSSEVLYTAFVSFCSVFTASYYRLLCVGHNSGLSLISNGSQTLTFVQPAFGMNRVFQLRNYKVFIWKSGFGTLLDLHGKFPYTFLKCRDLCPPLVQS